MMFLSHIDVSLPLSLPPRSLSLSKKKRGLKTRDGVFQRDESWRQCPGRQAVTACCFQIHFLPASLQNRSSGFLEDWFLARPANERIFWKIGGLKGEATVFLFLSSCSPTEGRIFLQWLYIVCAEKSSHCQYNENVLCDIDVTWQPRRVDWNAHV